MTDRVLTPYDTGHRLEPRPWSTPTRLALSRTAPSSEAMESETERFGRVDFDDDESATMLSVRVECPDPRADSRAYELVIEPVADLGDASGTSHEDDDREALRRAGLSRDSLSVRIDELRAFMVHADDAAGLQELCDLARRGRDDFLHQAEYGDYSEDDQTAAASRWEQVARQIERIEHFLEAARLAAEEDGDSDD